jgi:hypothetical protein
MSDTFHSIWEIANEMPPDAAIYNVEGTLTKLYPGKKTPHGTLQNGELTDQEGNFIKVTFADCNQPTTARNQFICLSSVSSQKHGWTGVKVKDDAQYGRSIWVTPSAQITYPNGAPAQQPQQQQRQQPPPRQPQGQQGQRRPQSGPRNPPPQNRQPQGGGQRPPSQPAHKETQFEAVEKFVACFLYVQSLVNERMSVPEGVTAYEKLDLAQRAAATIFVDVAKSGVAGSWNAKLKPRQFPPPPSDPKDWQQCYIDSESSKLHGKTLAEISDEDLIKLHEYYDGQKANHALAECVYQAAIDREVFGQDDGDPELLPDTQGEDTRPDIPF